MDSHKFGPNGLAEIHEYFRPGHDLLLPRVILDPEKRVSILLFNLRTDR
jgi:hypothetical protein